MRRAAARLRPTVAPIHVAMPSNAGRRAPMSPQTHPRFPHTTNLRWSQGRAHPRKSCVPWASAPAAQISSHRSAGSRRGGRGVRGCEALVDAGARTSAWHAAISTPPAPPPSAFEHLSAIQNVRLLNHSIRHLRLFKSHKAEAPGPGRLPVAHDNLPGAGERGACRTRSPGLRSQAMHRIISSLPPTRLGLTASRMSPYFLKCSLRVSARQVGTTLRHPPIASRPIAAGPNLEPLPPIAR